MSKTLSSINTAADTFQNWVDRTNSIITLIDTEVITANSVGALTTGNGFVNGFFGANTLVATNIKGGNVTTNSVITFITNTAFSANVLISQQLAVTNSVTFSNTLTITGNVSLSNTINVIGSANLQSSANVGGTLGVVGAATLSNTILITGSATLSNTINVVGAANLQSSANIGGTLGVVGAALLSNTLGVTGLITGSSGANITGTTNTSVALNVGANVNLTTSQFFIGNSSSNVVINSSSISTGSIAVNSSMITISGVNVATTTSLTTIVNNLGISNSVVFTGTSSQVLDSQTLVSTRSAEYIISANNNTVNAYQVSKILIIHDGTSAYVTEYGTMYTNTAVVTISAGANSTHMFVNCTPVSSNTTVKFTRFALGV